MPRIGRHVRVSGRVQGVWFRGWTQLQANELGITGWVRNCPDGSVEAQLEGEAGPVEQLIERLRDGPPSAVVGQLDINEIEPGNSDQFEVRH